MKQFSWVLGCVGLFFWLSVGGEDRCNLAGLWAGRAGASRLVFNFCPDGDASISVTVGNEMSTTHCRWQRVGQRISLTNARGQVRWFSILECAPDELTLRLDTGPVGVCHLRRTGEG